MRRLGIRTARIEPRRTGRVKLAGERGLLGRGLRGRGLPVFTVPIFTVPIFVGAPRLDLPGEVHLAVAGLGAIRERGPRRAGAGAASSSAGTGRGILAPAAAAADRASAATAAPAEVPAAPIATLAGGSGSPVGVAAIASRPTRGSAGHAPTAGAAVRTVLSTDAAAASDGTSAAPAAAPDQKHGGTPAHVGCPAPAAPADGSVSSSAAPALSTGAGDAWKGPVSSLARHGDRQRLPGDHRDRAVRLAAEPSHGATGAVTALRPGGIGCDLTDALGHLELVGSRLVEGLRIGQRAPACWAYCPQQEAEQADAHEGAPIGSLHCAN